MRSLTLLLVLASATFPASTGSGECSAADAWIGGCSNDGDEVVIDGRYENPGEPGTYPIGEPGPDTDTEWTPPSDWTPPPEFDFAQCLQNWDSYIHCFRGAEEADEDDPEDDAATPAIPAITITDVARFAPAGSAVSAEPDNVGVAGLPTNFVASVSVHTANGSLFGFPVAVRFTPSAYDFSFGDGSTTSTTSAGRSWADLGQAQFTPTPSSHAYLERGTYSARVDLRYTAEVDFGIGWFPISGEVTSAGAPQEVRIFEAHTALVAYTCQQSPDSPGC